jgi:signal transduction histidine kinase
MNAQRPNRRILLIDDLPLIHDDFRKILAVQAAQDRLNLLESRLFGVAQREREHGFELDCALQGAQGVAMATAALEAQRPYALAFVDMRMPPGWDGVETITRLWQADSALQVVLCTAYSDYSWDDVLDRLDGHERLLVLKKPFDAIEVRQLASTLVEKWNLMRQAAWKMDTLESAVRSRTEELSRANLRLQAEMDERKQLESRMVQTEKLASIGQLAAGVAHEINNPLGFLSSNFGMLEQYLRSVFDMLSVYESAEPGLEESAAALIRRAREQSQLAFLREDIPVLIAESREGMERVGKIVQSLKDFSRADTEQKWEWADLHRGIESTMTIIASEVRRVADVVREYGELPPVECVPSQLNQVVMNLLVNAVHATGAERGRIVIRTGAAGGEAWFEVQDSGCGIPADVLPRIFDPFFTTKAVGKGTGLGLSLSYGIVQRHQGRIEVTTAPGEGSTFRVILPVRQQLAAA